MTGELYWLFWARSMGVLPLIWLLLFVVFVCCIVWRFFTRDKKEAIIEESYEEEAFDLELRHGALTHLRNHCEEYDQWVFMNELYRLLIDAMWAKYNADEVLEVATNKQIETFSFLQQQEKLLLQTLYTPVFQSGEWTLEHKQKILDDVEHLVLWRDDLATHDMI